jgi:hypothetical protein
MKPAAGWENFSLTDAAAKPESPDALVAFARASAADAVGAYRDAGK